MKVVKLYRRPNVPEFYKLVRLGVRGMLVNYPIDIPDRKRQARWFALNEVYVDWIQEFREG